MANPECDNYMTVDPVRLERLCLIASSLTAYELETILKSATPTTLFELFKLFSIGES